MSRSQRAEVRIDYVAIVSVDGWTGHNPEENCKSKCEKASHSSEIQRERQIVNSSYDTEREMLEAKQIIPHN